MKQTIQESCRLIKLTSAEFAEAIRDGWPYEAPGAAIVEITPAMAKTLLATMAKNRPPKPLNKAKVKASLLGGYWMPNGEPIILDELLRLIDGQHRLEACVEADRPLIAVITWGWPGECFDTIDTGAKRSGGDVFSADGETNGTMLSATVRYDWRIVHRDMLSGQQIPEALMRTYLDRNPGLHAALSWGNKVAHLIPKGLGAALFYRFSQKDSALAKEFFDDIAKGENINARQHTAWHVRDWLGKHKGAHLRLDTVKQAELAAGLIKAWNGTRAGKVVIINQLSWQWRPPREERFPEIA